MRATLHTPTDIKPSWPDAIYGHFRRVGVRQVGYVPDAGHSRLIQLCQADNTIADVVLWIANSSTCCSRRPPTEERTAPTRVSASGVAVARV